MVERSVVHAPELAGAGGWINVAEPLSLAKLRGKIVLLDFWTYCCINCLHIVEELRPIEAAFPDDLVVIGVHSPKFPEERDHAAVERAVARHRITHPVLDDPDMITWRRYAVRAWPTLALIDARGYVRGMVSGEGHGPQIAEAVRLLIEEAREQGTLNTEPVLRATGDDALGRLAPARSTLAYPGKVAWDGAGRLAVADTGHDRVLLCTLGGEIEAAYGGLYQPQGVAFDGERLIVCDTGADRVVAFDLANVVGGRALTPGPYPESGSGGHSGSVTTSPESSSRVTFEPTSPAVEIPPLLDSGAGPGVRALWSPLSAFPDDPAPTVLATGISSPWDVVPWRGGLAVAEAGRHRLWFIDGRGEASVLAGTSGENIVDGPAATALLAQPSGLSVGPDGTLYIADSEVSALRQLRDGEVTTLAGKGLFEWGTADGDGETARLQHPLGVAADADGAVFVADTFNSRLRVWVDDELRTLPLRGLDEPGGLCLIDGGRLAVADTNHHRVLLYDPVTGVAESLPLPQPADPDHPPLRELPEAATVMFAIGLDLAGDELDGRDGPPVRLSVGAEPPALLGAGPRSWADEALPVRVELRTGRGEGTLIFDVQAASCLGTECRLHRRRITLPVRLGEGGDPGPVEL